MAGKVPVRELVTMWGFDIDDAPLKNLDRQIQSVQNTIKVVGTVAIAAGAGIFGLAKSVAAAGDNAAKTADKLGISVEALQEYRYAAKLAGVEQSALDMGLQRFIRRAAEAAQGMGEAKDALKGMGIQLRDSNGQMRPAEALFLDVAEAIKNTEDSSERLRLAFKLFDSEGVALVNMLKDGKAPLKAMREEARELGLVLSDSDARAAEKFEDNWTRLLGVLTGLKNIIGVELLPLFSDLFKQFKEYVIQNREFLKLRIGKALKILIEFVTDFVQVMRGAVNFLGRFTILVGGAENALMLLTKAMILFLSLKLTYALGAITLSLISLAKGMRLVGNAALIAQAKALAIPLAVGAALIALGLIAEDVLAYFQGRKSVTGIMVQEFEDAFASMKDSGQGWVNAFLRFASLILTPFRVIANVFRTISDLIDVITGKMSGKTWIANTASRILNNFGFGATKNPGRLLGGGGAEDTGFEFAEWLKSKFGEGYKAPSPTPSTPQIYRAGGGGTNLSVNAPVTVSVPAGTNPDQVGTAVQVAIQDTMDQILRQAARDNQSMIER